MPENGSLTLSFAHYPGGAGTNNVPHGDAKMTDLLVTLAD
jgi:hypothetical protein